MVVQAKSEFKIPSVPVGYENRFHLSQGQIIKGETPMKRLLMAFVTVAVATAFGVHCGEYGLESAALRNCMDRNGRSAPHNCVEASIDAGEVSRSEVERRKKR